MIIGNTPHRQAWQRYVFSTGATDRANLLKFCDGVYDLGLWDSMVCWPMRSTQNFGAGAVVQSLGGLGSYNGALVNGPTWGVSGLTFANAGTGTDYQKISIANSLLTSGLNNCLIGVFARSDQTNYGRIFELTDGAANGNSRLGSYAPANFLSASWPDKSSAGIQPLITVAINNGDFHSLIGSKSGNNFTVSLDASATNSATVTQSTYTLPTSAYATEIGTYFPGTIAFAAISRADMTYAQVVILNNLYKSTLGVGLSLP